MLPTGRPIQETSSWLPTLSTQGWCTGMFEKVNKILSYYLTSQYSQTIHHRGFVRSLPYTVSQHSNNPFLLSEKIREDILTIFKNYVDNIEVDVSYKQFEETSRYDYTISIAIIHEGYRWTGFRKIKVDNNSFEEIIDINNTGGGSLV